MNFDQDRQPHDSHPESRQTGPSDSVPPPVAQAQGFVPPAAPPPASAPGFPGQPPAGKPPRTAVNRNLLLIFVGFTVLAIVNVVVLFAAGVFGPTDEDATVQTGQTQGPTDDASVSVDTGSEYQYVPGCQVMDMSHYADIPTLAGFTRSEQDGGDDPGTDQGDGAVTGGCFYSGDAGFVSVLFKVAEDTTDAAATDDIFNFEVELALIKNGWETATVDSPRSWSRVFAAVTPASSLDGTEIVIVAQRGNLVISVQLVLNDPTNDSPQKLLAAMTANMDDIAAKLEK